RWSEVRIPPFAPATALGRHREGRRAPQWTRRTLQVPADEMEAMTERYDDLPPIPVHVLALG
ncbi:MAG TPA: hypothetical protein VF302_04245, partial [Candidatus Limnocylindrales bacterium]